MRTCLYQNEKHATKWEKMFAVFFHNKELKSYSKSMTDNPIEKLAKDLIGHFSQKGYPNN